MATTQPNGLDITTLSTPQLSALQQRLTTELEHLSTSHARLRTALGKFKDCLRCIASVQDQSKYTVDKQETLAPANSNQSHPAAAAPLLVPLTTSLYVPARPAKTDRVLVDVGTGYYVGKSCEQAITYYREKVKDVQGNMDKVERVVGQKSGDLRIVEEVLRERVLSEQQGQQGKKEVGS